MNRTQQPADLGNRRLQEMLAEAAQRQQMEAEEATKLMSKLRDRAQKQLLQTDGR